MLSIPQIWYPCSWSRNPVNYEGHWYQQTFLDISVGECALSTPILGSCQRCRAILHIFFCSSYFLLYPHPNGWVGIRALDVLEARLEAAFLWRWQKGRRPSIALEQWGVLGWPLRCQWPIEGLKQRWAGPTGVLARWHQWRCEMLSISVQRYCSWKYQEPITHKVALFESQKVIISKN